MKLIKILFLVCAFTLVYSSDALAGNPAKRGTAGAVELLMPVGARGTSLSGAGVAQTNGVESIHWNPAGLAAGLHGMNSEVIFSHMDYIADISIEYLGIGIAMGEFGSLGFSLRTLNFGDIPVTTEAFPDGTGEMYSPSFITLGLTYSKQLTDRISIGFTLKQINESIIRTSAHGVAIDAGVIYSVGTGSPLEGLKFGVALKNIGPNMRFDGQDLERYVIPPSFDASAQPQYLKFTSHDFELPSTFELGMSYDLSFAETQKIRLLGTFQNSNFGNDQIKGGLEYSFDDVLFLRGGYLTPDQNRDMQIFGVSYGAGLHYNLGTIALGVDYSYSNTDVFTTGIHTIAVRIGF